MVVGRRPQVLTGCWQKDSLLHYIGLLECPHDSHCFPTEQDLQERGQKGRLSDSCNLVLEITHCHFCHTLLARSKSWHTSHAQGERNQAPHLERRHIKEFLNIFQISPQYIHPLSTRHSNYFEGIPDNTSFHPQIKKIQSTISFSQLKKIIFKMSSYIQCAQISLISFFITWSHLVWFVWIIIQTRTTYCI